MVRIIVNPEQLRQLAGQLQGVAGDLRGVQGRLGGALSRLDWEARQRSGVEGRVSSARSQAEALANQAEGLAGYLRAKAQAFEEADGQGVQALGEVMAAYVAAQQPLLERQNATAAFPVEWLGRVLHLGDYLGTARTVSAGLLVADGIHYLRDATVVIDLPDVLRSVGVSLRGVRDWAGLSGHLNVIGYTNMPAHMLKIGLVTVPFAVAAAWAGDIVQYRGGQLASAMAVDAALPLAKVGASYASSVGGMELGVLIGTAIAPGPGTAVGGAAGAVLGGVAGGLASEWAVGHWRIRDTAIDWVDGQLQTTRQAIERWLAPAPAAMGAGGAW